MLEWVIKKTHDEIRSASNWVMGVILEKSKEEEVSGGREREIIEEHVLFLQERAKP